MPVYNTKPEMLREAIESILTQTYNDFEFIIVNDASNLETTKELLNNAEYDYRIKIHLHANNLGIAESLNTAIQNSTGNLLIRMDSDDIAHPKLIENHVKFFIENPEIDICGVQMKCFDKATFTTKIPLQVTSETAYNAAKYWICNHPGIAYRRKLIEKYMYNGSLKGMPEDYDLWVRMLNDGVIIHNVPDVLINYRVYAHRERTPGYMAFLEAKRQTLKQ